MAKTKIQIKRNLDRILGASYLNGMHRDDHWQPIYRLFRDFEAAGFPVMIDEARYEHDDNGDTSLPVRKVWLGQIVARDEKDKRITFHLRVVAAGAGSVQNPLDVYDVVAYVS